MFHSLYQNLFKENKEEERRCQMYDWDLEASSSIGTYFMTDNYEQMISTTGFGIFNVYVLLLLIPMEFAMQLQMYTMSFALPQIDCEFKGVNTLWKGLLITFNFIGMIPAGIVWTSFADVYGRRKILLIGMLAHCLIKIFQVFATTFTCLVLYEFFGGLIICGPYAIYLGQIYDFHSGQFRKRILFTYTIVVSLTNILIALLALLIMQRTYKLECGLFALHEWNFFILLGVLSSVITTAGIYMLPESPKYLMRACLKEDAANIVRYICWINRKMKTSRDVAPEISVERTLRMNNYSLSDMIDKVKVEFFSLQGLLKPVVLASVLQGFTMGSSHALKLWLPVLFEKVCGASLWKQTCRTEYYDSYFYTLIVTTSLIASIVIVVLFSYCPGHTARFMIAPFFVAAAASFSLYYITHFVLVLFLIGAYLMLMSTLNIIVITVIYESMPTNIRLSMAYQFSLTTGRIFVVLETICFGFLYTYKCATPFIFLGLTALAGALIALFITPRHQ